MIDYITEFVLIEDNPDHALLTKKTVEMVSNSVKVRNFGDAESGIGYLRAVAEANLYSSSKTRVVLFLDLNLPGMDGLDCLREIRREGAIAGTPVVVLTTSEANEDFQRANSVGANSFLTKPSDFKKFKEMIEVATRYWAEWDQLVFSEDSLT